MTRTGTLGHRRSARWALGLLPLSLGVVALVAAGFLLLARDGGWPWHASLTTTSEGGSVSATAAIDDDNTHQQFTGTPAEAQAWLDRQESALKERHGLTTKIAVGEVLQKIGLLLVASGGGVLLWQLTKPVIRRLNSRRNAAGV